MASTRVAYRLLHDELMLDGNSRQNLATFVTTWMDPEADQLMAETFDKNMIDKDEYPRRRRSRPRCVAMVAELCGTRPTRAGDRDLDDRIERGGHARRAGAEVAVAGAR